MVKIFICGRPTTQIKAQMFNLQPAFRVFILWVTTAHKILDFENFTPKQMQHKTFLNLYFFSRFALVLLQDLLSRY